MTTTPAYVRNARLDILAANRLGRALYSPILTSPAQPANHARFLFLDPGAAQFYVDWERQAQDTVALLRTEAGRNPHDKALSGLIGELSTAAGSSAPGGPRTTSASTAPGSSACITRWSVTSASRSRRWTWPRTPACGSPRTPLSPAHPRPTP